MPARKVSTGRKILYSGITIVLLLLVVELISRAYYYRRQASHSLAVVQLMHDLRTQVKRKFSKDTLTARLQQGHYLVRPNFSKQENDEVNREHVAANQAVYEPWVEFAFRDIRSKYVNVQDHMRRSIPQQSDSSGTTKPYTIFFLGGSTMYGFNVTDEETIPSAFVRAYQRKYPQGRPIRVVNWGMPFYFSYQELIQLADQLFRDNKPDMVIMLDGLNDCLQANATFKRQPVFAPGIQDLVRPGTAAADRTQQPDYYELPAKMSADSACRMVVQRYIDNIRHAREITAAYNIPLYCFWQPVPYYNYPHRPNDPICTQSSPPRFSLIYPMVKAKTAEIPYLFFLGDMLQDEKELPFIDQIHYSPGFNRTIAEKMLDIIRFD
ncbi:MAG TPA: SGNH/GDSL hydrolase family protein [Puia sp.]|jgi:hypothetical protein